MNGTNDDQVRRVGNGAIVHTAIRCPGCGSAYTRAYASKRDRAFKSDMVPSGVVFPQYRVCALCETTFRIFVEQVEDEAGVDDASKPRQASPRPARRPST